MTHTLSRPCDVIIVNYNAGELLQSCVRSTLVAGARRVIVVDNGSRDGSVEAAESAIASEQLTVMRNGDNLGFARACNVGAQASDADVLLFLNPDCVLAPEALERMMGVLDSEEGAGMVGGLLCNPDGSEQPGGRRDFPTPRRAFARAFGLSRLGRIFPSLFPDFLLHQAPLPAGPVDVDAISGACMLVRREAIDDIGLWDEGYFLHCEDLDWCMRFKLGGWRVVFVPDARVMHVGGACSRTRPVFVEWHKHRGMLRFYTKFFRRRYSPPLWWLVVLGVWLRFALVSLWQTGRRLLARLAGR